MSCYLICPLLLKIPLTRNLYFQCLNSYHFLLFISNFPTFNKFSCLLSSLDFSFSATSFYALHLNKIWEILSVVFLKSDLIFCQFNILAFLFLFLFYSLIITYSLITVFQTIFLWINVSSVFTVILTFLFFQEIFALVPFIHYVSYLYYFHSKALVIKHI